MQWSLLILFDLYIGTQELKVGQLKDETIRVVTVDHEPFIEITTNKTDGKKTYSGFCIELLKELQKILGFQYEFVEATNDESFGQDLHGNGSFNGMIGMVQNNHADIILADIPITSDTAQFIDFSVAFLETGFSFVTLSEHTFNAWAFLEPFDNKLWLYIFFTVLLVSLFMYISNYISPFGYYKEFYKETPHFVDTSNNPCQPPNIENLIKKEFYSVSLEQEKQAMNLSNALFWGWAGLFWQSPETVPRAPSSRIPAILWYAAGVTIVASYTANLVTFLTVRKQKIPLDTFINLRSAMYQRGFSYGFVKNSAAEMYFCSSSDKLMVNICNDINDDAHSDWRVASTKDGITRAREPGYAFIADHILLEHIISTHEPCNLRISQGRMVGKFGFGLGLKKNSKYTNAFSVGILKMRENLLISDLYERWIKQDGLEKPADCNSDTPENNNQNNNKLTYDNLKGLFFLVWGSLVIGIFMIGVEWLISCYSLINRLDKQAPQNLYEAFKQRLKFMQVNQKEQRKQFKRDHSKYDLERLI